MTDFKPKAEAERPVRTADELEALFHDGAKPREAWKIGVEYEKPVVARETGEAVAYDGPRGIRRLLEELDDRYDWDAVHERDNLIALRDSNASITLEPGGQFELSGRQCDSLHCAAEELERHVREITSVGRELGLSFLGLGITPKTPLERCPQMPKQRYRFMREIMQRTGSLGLRMMHQTCTVQANFDYSDERDAARKFRLGMALSPVIVAMAANSPVVDGRASGYRSFRAHVWTDTDNARCGVLPFAFETDSLFSAYTQYALDVPMYFIQRGSELLPSGDKSFRRFMAEGHSGQHATMNDWEVHLTTLFPEVRLKTYIELRAADSQTVPLMLATPAFAKGLLYDDDCMAAAWDVVGDWPLATRMGLNEEAARNALSARVGRFKLRDFALELVDIALEGLRRQGALDPSGADEGRYLQPLREDVAAGRSPADTLIDLWENEWDRNVDRMISHCSYSDFEES